MEQNEQPTEQLEASASPAMQAPLSDQLKSDLAKGQDQLKQVLQRLEETQRTQQMLMGQKVALEALTSYLAQVLASRG